MLNDFKAHLGIHNIPRLASTISKATSVSGMAEIYGWVLKSKERFFWNV